MRRDMTRLTDAIRAAAARATLGPWKPMFVYDHAILSTDAAYLALLDPATVTRLLDVVDAVRNLVDRRGCGCWSNAPHTCAVERALATLDREDSA